MPISVNCSDFTGNYLHLNGAQSISCNYSRLLLAAFTCGYSGYYQPHKGNWLRRVIQILGAVSPFIQANRHYGFVLNPYFFTVDSSENKHGIYFIGQALTKIFAETVLNAPLVQHASRCSWVPINGVALKAPLLTRGRKEADLFAYDSSGNCHILEAKGRSIKDGSLQLSNSTFNRVKRQALAQVSSVGTVNGILPSTRSACIWSICTSGIKGDVIDPEGEGFDVEVSPLDIIESSYGLILDSRNANYNSDIISGYDVVEIQKGIYFGVMSEIRSALLNGETSLDYFISKGFESVQLNIDDRNVTRSFDGTLIFTPEW